MWNKLKESKSFYIILSLLLAVLLWAYVVSEANPSKEQALADLPVNFQGTDVLETRNLIITSGANQTVDLTLHADWNTAGKLNRNNVSLSVSVSGITEPGDYRLRADVVYPGNVSRSNIAIQNDEILYIEFTVAKLITKEIPVQPKFVGSVADGYQAGEFTVASDVVEIRGQEEYINQVASAEVILGQENMDRTYQGDLPLTFKDALGNELDRKNIQCDVNTIYVIYPIVMVKDLPLTVSFLAGGGATEDNVDPDSFSIEPSTISLSGPESVLAGLEEWPLGEIDLSLISSAPNTKLKLPVRVSEQLVNESGITEATVTITLKGLATKEFEVDNIKLTNVPEGYQAELVTLSRIVLLRGTQEELDRVFQAQIRIEADWSQLPSDGVGRQTVPAKVYVDGSSVGAVGSYSIVVNISRT